MYENCGTADVSCLWQLLGFMPLAHSHVQALETCAAAYPLQAVWVYATLLPVLLLNTSSLGGPAALLWSDIVGAAVYATGRCFSIPPALLYQGERVR